MDEDSVMGWRTAVHTSLNEEFQFMGGPKGVIVMLYAIFIPIAIFMVAPHLIPVAIVIHVLIVFLGRNDKKFFPILHRSIKQPRYFRR